MNQSIVITGAVVIISGVTGGSSQAGPALLDFPGPGYRQQSELVHPHPKDRKVDSTAINFEWPTFETPKIQGQSIPWTEPDKIQPFSEPIRLHIDMTIRGVKTDLQERSTPSSPAKN